MECNNLIKAMLKAEIKCTEDFFGVFCLFANGIMTFDDVLKAAQRDNLDFEQLCINHGFDYNLIADRQ